MKLQGIKELPNTINNIHESCFRSYHILSQVLEMIERGDSKETISEIVEYLRIKDVDKTL